ncbi:MAG: hypothetical protein KDK36_01780 [Leptospiraceae bacterium]|nr:hypothetical protein [Leptospiraceae bacterium]
MKFFMVIVQTLGYALIVAGVGSTLNASFGWNIGLRSAGPLPADYVSAAAFFILGAILAIAGTIYIKKHP